MTFQSLDYCRFAAAVLTWTAAGSLALADPPPPEMIDFVNAFEPEFRALAQSPSLDDLGALTGLWVAEAGEDNEDIDLVHIQNFGSFLLEYVVNRETGALSAPIGYARKQGDVWGGWFSIACKGCCPGKTWWDKGAAFVDSADRVLAVKVDSVKLNRETCELTDEPDQVDLRSKLIDTFEFGEFLPGKTIHIVAAPQVGNQRAQYKAAVRPKWDIGGYGIAAIDLVVNGPGGGMQLLNKSRDLSGQLDYTTEYAGTHRFIFVAYNAAGQPLHFEIESIDIPPIRGIN